MDQGSVVRLAQAITLRLRLRLPRRKIRTPQDRGKKRPWPGKSFIKPNTTLYLGYPLPRTVALFANPASPVRHALLSSAQVSHFCPCSWAYASEASSHLVAGLPRLRSPPCGIQCSIRTAHLPSLRLETWPAHLHLRTLCCSTVTRG